MRHALCCWRKRFTKAVRIAKRGRQTKQWLFHGLTHPQNKRCTQNSHTSVGMCIDNPTTGVCYYLNFTRLAALALSTMRRACAAQSPQQRQINRIYLVGSRTIGLPVTILMTTGFLFVSLNIFWCITILWTGRTRTSFQ